MNLPPLSLSLVLEILWLRRWWCLLPMLAVPTVAVVVGQQLPQKYKAHAELLVQDGGEVHLLLEDLQVPWTVKNRLPLIKSLLRSRAVLKEVLIRLGEIEPNDDEETVELRLKHFRKQISVFGQGGGVVRISLVGTTPAKAKEALQEVMRNFIDEMLRPQRQGVEESTSFLVAQLARLQKELTTIEEEIAQFKHDNADELPDAFRLNLDAYMALREQLTQAQVRLERASRKESLFEERMKTFDPVAQELESRLIQAKAQSETLDAVFTNVHPEVQANRARVNALETQLKSRLRKVPRTGLSSVKQKRNLARKTIVLASDLREQKRLSSEVNAIQGEIERLKGLLKEGKLRVEAHAVSELKLTRLMRTATTKAGIYQMLLKRYEEAMVTQALSLLDEGSQIWVIDPPAAPVASTRISIPMLALVGLFGGAILGILQIALLEMLSDRIRCAGEVEKLLGCAAIVEFPASSEK
ncbi:MAG: hypothetical protein GY822_01105 [Deltaproteobacteria bacterium]|nr:hypothetical protein [Deltaproteobacteria bacterium]